MTKRAVDNIENIESFEDLFKAEKRHGKTSNVMTSLVKMNAKRIIVSLLLFIIKASPEWIVPLITADIIDVATNWATNPDTNRLIIDCVIAFVLIVQNVPMHIWNAKVNDEMVRRTSVSLKTTIVRKLQSLSLTYHRELESGKIQAKFLRDTENADMLFRQIVANLIPTLLSVVIACAISFAKSPLMTLFFILVIPANVFVSTRYYRRMRREYRDLRVQNEEISSRMSRMLQMFHVTKSHGLEENEYNEFEDSARRLYKKGRSVDRTQASFGSAIWVVEELFKVACLVFSVLMTINDMPGFTIGAVVLYQSLFANINSNTMRLVSVFPQISSGTESLKSLSEIMNSEDIEVNAGKAPVCRVKGEIEFVNASYRYPDSSDYAVKDFSLKVSAGECIAFVGASGSGKSTLINMIIGLLKPTEGEMLIDGRSVNDINLFEYRHSISVVPQNSILFTGTIRENITYGMTSYTEEELKRALEMSAVTEFLPELPDGLDTNVGERGEKLSGGQRQRVTIARALIRNPGILILDEATSALDNVSEYHVQKAIECSMRDRTTFIVAHRLSTIRNADRIVVMDSGKIVETGTYDQLMELKGKFYEMKLLSDVATKSMEHEVDTTRI